MQSIFGSLLMFVALGSFATPARADASRDWLLWNTTDGPAIGKWETRWFHLGDRGPEVLAKRAEPIASDGTHLWSLVVQHAEVPLRSCECMGGMAAPGCKVVGNATAWSLTAVDLADASETVILEAATEFMGADPDENLVLFGSAGAHVFASRTRAASPCETDARPVREFLSYDLGRSQRDRRMVADRLPISLVSQVATQLADSFTKCATGFQKWTDEVRRDMKLDGWSLRVKDGGHLQIRWTFSAESDFLACREARLAVDVESPTMAEAGSLGLASAPPDVIDTALATGQSEGTLVGFAAFNAEGDDRTAALARFKSAPAHAAVVATEGAAKRVLAEQKSALGRQLARGDKASEAIAAFSEALEADPELANAWAGRGRAKLLAGDLPGAKSDLEKAFQFIRDTDQQVAVWFDLGQVAERAGDKKSARAAYKSAQQIRPSPLIDEALARLK